MCSPTFDLGSLLRVYLYTVGKLLNPSPGILNQTNRQHNPEMHFYHPPPVSSTYISNQLPNSTIQHAQRVNNCWRIVITIAAQPEHPRVASCSQEIVARTCLLRYRHPGSREQRSGSVLVQSASGGNRLLSRCVGVAILFFVDVSTLTQATRPSSMSRRQKRRRMLLILVLQPQPT
jgi:hypothetical protein